MPTDECSRQQRTTQRIRCPRRRDASATGEGTSLKGHDASLRRRDASVKRHDASLRRQDVSVRRQDASVKRHDASLRRQDASLKRHDASLRRQDASPGGATWQRTRRSAYRRKHSRPMKAPFGARGDHRLQPGQPGLPPASGPGPIPHHARRRGGRTARTERAQCRTRRGDCRAVGTSQPDSRRHGSGHRPVRRRFGRDRFAGPEEKVRAQGARRQRQGFEVDRRAPANAASANAGETTWRLFPAAATPIAARRSFTWHAGGKPSGRGRDALVGNFS